MKNFIKSGNKIFISPKGMEYELESGRVYTLKYNEWEGTAYFEINENINIPNKIYGNNYDSFINRILQWHKRDDVNNTGVLLSGMKGSGKTLTSKIIAKKSGLPIIVVDNNFLSRKLSDTFKKISGNYCIIFDEIDKNERYWDSSQLLGFLDGIETVCKKLVLFTCNDENFANENLIDRCSRIRYYKKFEGLDNNSISNLINEIIKDDKKKQMRCLDLINKFKVKSFDNIVNFLHEVQLYPDSKELDLLNDLNIEIQN